MAGIGAKGRALKERAAQVIPNGMYGHESVRMLPENYPQFFARAEGARLWDVDDNAYVDMMCAYGPNLLGYRHPQIEAAAQAQAALGDTLTGPGEVMVDLAEALVAMIGHADWAMFCKNGGDATNMCMVTARAHTKRRKILLAQRAYHGALPWNTPVPAGILPEDRAHIVYYRYGDLDSLADAMKAHEGDVAAVFATPFRHETFEDQSQPLQAFAQGVRRLCDEAGALLVVDEVRAGFRLARGSSWEAMGVTPDLSAFGKVLGNGHPISAMVGREPFRAAAGSIFVTGSFWFSAVPMAAAVATLKIIRDSDYLEKSIEIGTRLRLGIAERATAQGFDLVQSGPAQMPQMLFADDQDMRLGYFWTSAVLRYGAYLHPYHNMFVTSAMSEADIACVLDATEAGFADLKQAAPTLGAPQNPLLAARTALRRAAE